MMLDHLGRHPDLYAYRNETRILPYFLQTQSRYGDLQQDRCFLRLWNDIRSSFIFRRKNRGRPLDLPADWRSMPRNAAAIFDRVMREFASKEGKTRWAEKTPMHVLHIARLAEAFEGSTFIHMIRDGRDCAASDHRRWGRHPAATIYRWKQAVDEGRRQGRSIGCRYIEIRYEEVTEAPDRYLKIACEFARLKFDERVCRTERAHRHIKGNATQAIVPNRDRNTGYFNGKRLRTLESIAGRRLAELGYPTEYVEGDRTPSLVSRTWWVIHDGYRVSLRQIRMKVTKQYRMSVLLMLHRWKGIIQSKLSNIRYKTK